MKSIIKFRKRFYFHSVILWLIFCFTPAGEVASQNSFQQEYFHRSFSEHPFNPDTWKKATDGLDYSDTRKSIPLKEKNITPLSPAISEQTMRVIALIVLFSVLIIILLKTFGINSFRKNKRQTNETAFHIPDSEEPIPESELHRFLRDALQKNNFKLAIRIYYLITINELAARRMIVWRKEKTNSDYILELRNATPYIHFREMTLIFERVWYGEYMIDGAHFNELSGRFEQLISSIRNP